MGPWESVPATPGTTGRGAARVARGGGRRGAGLLNALHRALETTSSREGAATALFFALRIVFLYGQAKGLA